MEAVSFELSLLPLQSCSEDGQKDHDALCYAIWPYPKPKYVEPQIGSFQKNSHIFIGPVAATLSIWTSWRIANCARAHWPRCSVPCSLLVVGLLLRDDLVFYSPMLSA